MAFKKASRTQKKLRLAIFGVTGAGKSLTAIRLGSALARRIAAKYGRAPKLAVIDTENGSMSCYEGDVWDGHPLNYDVSDLKDFSPTSYTNEIRAAGKAGYDVVVIDSLSHAWAGKGGALDIQGKAADSSGNSYTAWRTVTPMHNELVESMIQSSCHVISTMRSHMDYVQEKNEHGKTVVRKIGLNPVQRDGMLYEFDIAIDIDDQHIANVVKSRCSAIDGMRIVKPGAELMDLIAEWLENGNEISQDVIEAVQAMESKPATAATATAGTAEAGAAKSETREEKLKRLAAKKAAEQAAKEGKETAEKEKAKEVVTEVATTPEPTTAAPNPSPLVGEKSEAAVAAKPEVTKPEAPKPETAKSETKRADSTKPTAIPASKTQLKLINTLFQKLAIFDEGSERFCLEYSHKTARYPADLSEITAGRMIVALSCLARIKGLFDYMMIPADKIAATILKRTGNRTSVLDCMTPIEASDLLEAVQKIAEKKGDEYYTAAMAHAGEGLDVASGQYQQKSGLEDVVNAGVDSPEAGTIAGEVVPF